MDYQKRNDIVPIHQFERFDIRNQWISNKEKRLDANFYAKDVMAANVIIKKLKEKGITIEDVGAYSTNVFWPGRFKRKYVSKEEGNPFLTPSEIFMFLPKPNKFIIDYSEELSIEDGWLLVTRSGSVGRCLIATKLLKTFVLSDDLIRLVPKDIKNIGYLYAYLKTWIGQTLLIKDQYGATVKHIEPLHVSNIPLPRIPKLEKEINEKILRSHKLREESQTLLLIVENLLHETLGLSKLDEEDASYFGKKGILIKSSIITSTDLNLRLDASYHIPLAHFSISNMQIMEKNGLGEIKTLKELANSFVPKRFKRAYVEDANIGIPLLQGKHVSQLKPLNLKYLWKKMKNIKDYTVFKNWILVTCSGTIGRLSLVSDYWEGWTATNHLLRLIVHKDKIHPGYLTAFLLSDYGQIQFSRLIYGGVVDEIGEAGELFNDILILKPSDKKLENRIGSLVMEAYNKRDEANKIEDDAIKVLEEKLAEIAE